MQSSDPDRQLTRVGANCLILPIMAELGHDPARLCAAAGVDAAALADPDALVPAGDIARLLATVIARTGRRDIGLLVAARAGIRYTGPLFTLLAAEPDLRALLHTNARLLPLNTRVAAARLLADEEEARFEIATSEPFSDVTASYDDGVMAITVMVLRAVLGDGWQPAAVELAHAPTGPIARYRAVFGLTPRFHQLRSAIIMPASDLDRRLPRPEPGQLEQARRATADTADRLGIGIIDRTRARIRARLADPNLALESIAGELGLSRRTLNRRLASHGTSFADLLRQVRYTAARQMLTQSLASLGDIATALGYADQTAFSRAFRQWSGQSPRRLRVEQRGR